MITKEELQENGNEKAIFDVSKITVFSVMVSDDTTQKTTTKTTTKIISAIINNPHIKQQELADLLGISFDGVKWQLKKLKESGILQREGNRRGGKWIINKNKID